MTAMPEIEGSVRIRSTPDRFAKAFRQRVADGLLGGRPGLRSDYRVAEPDSRELRIRAGNLATAINVGLNDITLRFEQGSIRYEVRYWRWARYVLSLSAVIAVIGVAALLSFDVRGYIGAHPTSRVGGLSLDANLLLLWAIVLFWGFVWPWLLIAIHKRPLRRLIVRLIGEVDAAAAS